MNAFTITEMHNLLVILFCDLLQSVLLCIYDRRNGLVVKVSALQSIDLRFIPLVESYQKTLKNGICSFPAWRSAFMGDCGKQAGKFACFVLGQGTYRDAPSIRGRQMTRKWQLRIEC